MPYEMKLNDGSKILVSDDISKDEAEKAISTAINVLPQQQVPDKLTLFRDVLSRVSNAITAPKPPAPPRLSSPFSAIASGKYINDLMNDLRVTYQAELERYKAMMQERAQLRMEELERRKMELDRLEKDRMFLLTVLQNSLNYKNMRETLLLEQQKHRDMMSYRYDQLQNDLARLREDLASRKEIEEMRRDLNYQIAQMNNAISLKNVDIARETLELRKKALEESSKRSDFANALNLVKSLQALGLTNDEVDSVIRNVYGDKLDNQFSVNRNMFNPNKNINSYIVERKQSLDGEYTDQSEVPYNIGLPETE